MADKKISQLTGATTPLAGTEVLPIVQSGSTVKVSVDNLTAGKTVKAATFDTDVAAAKVTLTGTTLTASGTDANINIAIDPKGTGALVVSKNVTVTAGNNYVKNNVSGTDSTAFVSNSSGTGANVMQLVNTGGTYAFGIENSASTYFGSTAYAYTISIPSTRVFEVFAGGVGSLLKASAVSTDVTVSQGNLAIGTAGKAIVDSGGVSRVEIASGSTVVNQSGADLDFRVEGDADANLLFVDASTDRIGIGYNAPDTKVHIRGTGTQTLKIETATSGDPTLSLSAAGVDSGEIWYGRADSRLYARSSNSGGVYLAAGGTTWTSVSDERKKDILEPIENAVEKVSSLRAVIGKYKADEDNTRRAFLIAQDVQAVLPEAVDSSNADELGLAYTDTIPLLVAAIKEQQAMISELKAKVAALEANS
jgi:hypothetical protein